MRCNNYWKIIPSSWPAIKWTRLFQGDFFLSREKSVCLASWKVMTDGLWTTCSLTRTASQLLSKLNEARIREFEGKSSDKCSIMQPMQSRIGPWKNSAQALKLPATIKVKILKVQCSAS